MKTLLAYRGLYSQTYGFSSSYVWMWEFNRREGWPLKNWCFGTVVLAKTRESLGLQGNQTSQSWIFTGGTDAEAETPILWPPDAKNWLIGKDRDAGKDWRQKDKGTTEDEMVGWHTDSVDLSLSKLWEMVKDRKDWHTAVHGVAKNWIRLNDWRTTKRIISRDQIVFISGMQNWFNIKQSLKFIF